MSNGTKTKAMFLTTLELAKRWRVSQQHIRDLIREGKLKAFRAGAKAIRIPRKEVEALEGAAV